MKIDTALITACAIMLGGCVNPTADHKAHLAPQVGEPFRQVLHRSFDWNSVPENQVRSLYEILELLHRSDLGDEQVVAVEFVSEDEAIVTFQHRDRSIVVHPSGSRRVERRAGFWVLAPPDRYRPV